MDQDIILVTLKRLFQFLYIRIRIQKFSNINMNQQPILKTKAKLFIPWLIGITSSLFMDMNDELICQGRNDTDCNKIISQSMVKGRQSSKRSNSFRKRVV